MLRTNEEVDRDLDKLKKLTEQIMDDQHQQAESLSNIMDAVESLIEAVEILSRKVL